MTSVSVLLKGRISDLYLGAMAFLNSSLIANVKIVDVRLYFEEQIGIAVGDGVDILSLSANNTLLTFRWLVFCVPPYPSQLSLRQL